MFLKQKSKTPLRAVFSTMQQQLFSGEIFSVQWNFIDGYYSDCNFEEDYQYFDNYIMVLTKSFVVFKRLIVAMFYSICNHFAYSLIWHEYIPFLFALMSQPTSEWHRIKTECIKCSNKASLIAEAFDK